jgi:hypothetical protein
MTEIFAKLASHRLTIEFLNPDAGCICDVGPEAAAQLLDGYLARLRDAATILISIKVEKLGVDAKALAFATDACREAGTSEILGWHGIGPDDLATGNEETQ